MIILDTNVISELMKAEPDQTVAAWLSNLSGLCIATTAVTVSEIEYGIGRLPDGARRRDIAERFAVLIAAMNVLPLDAPSATFAGRFRAEREQMGMPVTPSDMMIAGIVKVADATLATRNGRDFEHLPVTCVNPWDRG